jgi:signal transduction histidine kinase
MRTELEVGLKKQDLGEEIRQLFLSQLEEIRRLQEIVGEFLIVSQLKEGTLLICQEPFDLSALILKVFNQLLPLLQQKEMKPSIRFDEEIPGFIVQGDEDKIRIVLLNLLENAIKYGVNGSIISCSIEIPERSNELTILFTNTIREEKINTESLHTAFFRMGPLSNGAGLGLWLCGEIVRLHWGRMEMTSGAHQFTVKVILPSAV